MYDPWLNERQATSSRVEAEAAHAARQAASVLGQEQVSQQLAEARAMGERQAIEAAQRLEAEAHHVQHMHYLQATGQIGGQAPVAGVSGISSPSQGLPTRPPPYVSPEEKAARAQAELDRQRAQAEKEVAERIRLLRRDQKRALAAVREHGPYSLTGGEIFMGTLAFLSTALIAYLGISLSVLLVTGSWNGGFSWMWMCVLGVALAIPIAPIATDAYEFSFGLPFIPILLSALHLREDLIFWGAVPLLITICLFIGIVFALDLFSWDMWNVASRRRRNLLRRKLPCDYCGRPSSFVKRIDSRFGEDKITVLACWDHSHSTPWTEELEVALLDKTFPPNGQ